MVVKFLHLPSKKASSDLTYIVRGRLVGVCIDSKATDESNKSYRKIT